MTNWWYVTAAPDGSNQQRSVSEDELINLLQSGQLTRQTLVWRDGMDNWQPVQDIAALVPYLASLPPQIPPAAHASRAAASQTAVKYAGYWRRFFARMIDLWWESVLALLLFAILMGILQAFSSEDHPVIIIALLIFLILIPTLSVIIVDSVCYYLFKKTPGKYITGIMVTNKAGDPVDSITYFKRNLRVYFFGMGCYLWAISFIAMLIQSRRVAEKGHTRYDEKHNLEVRIARPANKIAITVVLAMVILSWLLFINMRGFLPAPSVARTNPLTHKTVSIDGAWKMKTNPDVNQKIIFSSNFGKVSVSRFKCPSLQVGIRAIQITTDYTRVKKESFTWTLTSQNMINSPVMMYGNPLAT